MVLTMQKPPNFCLHLYYLLLVFFSFFHQLIHVSGAGLFDALWLGHTFAIFIEVLSVWIVGFVIAAILLVSHRSLFYIKSFSSYYIIIIKCIKISI